MAPPHVRAGRAWLDVPFSDKDAAKAAGARWDPTARRWYAPRLGLPAFARWAPVPETLPGEDRGFGTGLYADPIPSTAWWTHTRYCIAPGDWERVRNMVYRRTGNRCEACGARPDREAGRYLEAHERWLYDEARGVQVLRRLICLCTPCHETTHYGLAQIRGRGDQALTHLCAVTGMPEAEAVAHLHAAFALWQQRSQMLWELDLSILTGAGVGIVRPAGSGASRAEWAQGRRQGGQAAAQIRTGPEDDAAPRHGPCPWAAARARPDSAHAGSAGLQRASADEGRASMIVDLDIPDGHGQVRLRLPGGWPGLAELADIADALADSASCPECGHMPASDFLRAMADVAPAHLATALRELAGPEPAPGPAPDDAGGGLAALYEKHADQLAAIEAAYKIGPSGLLR